MSDHFFTAFLQAGAVDADNPRLYTTCTKNIKLSSHICFAGGKKKKVIHKSGRGNLEKWSYTRSYTLYPQKMQKKNKHPFCEQIINLHDFCKILEKRLTKPKCKNGENRRKLSHKSDKTKDVAKKGVFCYTKGVF